MAILYKCSLQKMKFCEAIMNDLFLFTPTKKTHMAKPEDFFKASLENGLKISPRKCQHFRKELQYMRNTILIKGRGVCVKPLRIV